MGKCIIQREPRRRTKPKEPNPGNVVVIAVVECGSMVQEVGGGSAVVGHGKKTRRMAALEKR